MTGIPFEDANHLYKETGIMKNNHTGDIMKTKKVSHIQVVK